MTEFRTNADDQDKEQVLTPHLTRTW